MTGQAISSENQWLWGNQGINYFNVNNKFHHTWHARSLSDNRAVAFYTDYGTTIDENTLNALAVNNLGEYVWPSQTVSISSVPSSIIHPACSGFAFHQFVLAWEDDRSGQTDIYAQNLSEFGTLGVVNATNQELLFNATYIYSNPANGKQVHFNTGDFDRIAIYDNSGSSSKQSHRHQISLSICILTILAFIM